MAGSYNGTDFGGASTWFESVTGRTAAQERQAAINVANAMRGGKSVVSADGERFWLALPSSPSRPVTQVSPGVPTRGPGRASVGSAPTGGPGVIRVGGVVPTKGAGAGKVRVGGPVAGSGAGVGVVMQPKSVPLERVGGGLPVESYGSISDIGWARTANGWAIVPSNDMKQRMEDDVFQELQWQVRNNVGPYFGVTGGSTHPDWGDPANYERDWLTLEYKPKPGTVKYIGGGF